MKTSLWARSWAGRDQLTRTQVRPTQEHPGALGILAGMPWHAGLPGLGEEANDREDGSGRGVNRAGEEAGSACSYRVGIGLDGVAEVGPSCKLVKRTSQHGGHICQGLRQVRRGAERATSSNL